MPTPRFPRLLCGGPLHGIDLDGAGVVHVEELAFGGEADDRRRETLPHMSSPKLAARDHLPSGTVSLYTPAGAVASPLGSPTYIDFESGDQTQNPHSGLHFEKVGPLSGFCGIQHETLRRSGDRDHPLAVRRPGRDVKRLGVGHERDFLRRKIENFEGPGYIPRRGTDSPKNRSTCRPATTTERFPDGRSR